MSQTITVDEIYYNEKKKDGTLYTNRKGKPYLMIKVKSDGEYYTLWDWKANYEGKKYQIGDTIEGEVTEDNGFKSITVKEKSKADEKFEALEQRIEALEDAVYNKDQVEKEEKELEKEIKEEEPEDIPF